MSISTITPPDDWILISTTSITTTASSVDYTSLSDYSAYLIFASSVPTASSTNLACRINASSSLVNYAQPFGTTTNFPLTNNNTTSAKTGALVIYDALKTGPKKIEGSQPSTVSGSNMYFYDAAAVTQITIRPGAGTFNSAGTLYLFGKL